VYPRLVIKTLLLLFAAVAFGQQPAQQTGQKSPQSSGPAHTPVLVIPAIGDGIMPIDGAWQFHLGDDTSWAQPSLDDSGWESIAVDGPWGTAGHPSYAGFAWYRRHLDIVPAAGETASLRSNNAVTGRSGLP
jgi:hypothetical protein